jgi:ubiquinone/menaquinone biosynthesis C-methylase UbiE
MSGNYAANLTNHNPAVYNTNASFVYSAKFTNAVLGLLDAKPGERIIDLGCGTGELTRQLKEAVGKEGVVVGVDSSETMVRTSS